MKRNSRLVRQFVFIACLVLSLAAHSKGVVPGRNTAGETTAPHADESAYKWNVSQRGLPLLGLLQDRLHAGFEQSLTYPTGHFEFPIFKPLTFDAEQGKYLLPAISQFGRNAIVIEFNRTPAANVYTSAEGLELFDRGNTKTIRTPDGTRFSFVEYPDGDLRCASIREAGGGVLNLLYTANGLALHGVIDANGRTLTFNYGEAGIRSLTQNWMADLAAFTKTWAIGEEIEDASTKFAHSVNIRMGKFLPANAVIHDYTSEMIACDKLLAEIFGGPQAVAGGNGFEPAGLAASYPFYRGDVIGDDGVVRRGHLSHALHLYGSPDGRGESPLYIPAGFTSHSSAPTPTDAAMIFYYPRLGNLTDVTLAVFHVADFQMVSEGERVRIGNIGGPGGASPLYKHSHIEFYRGNIGLPSPAARAGLRIDPAIVFSHR